jgi:m7GpppX diphosphatase
MWFLLSSFVTSQFQVYCGASNFSLFHPQAASVKSRKPTNQAVYNEMSIVPPQTGMMTETLGVVRSPARMLKDPSSQAQVLNLSDQNVAILLTNGEERSLLQLTIEPFHKVALPGPGQQQQGSGKQILDFLSQYDFELTSESGAEYSYYHATPKLLEDDLWSIVSRAWRRVAPSSSTTATSITPAATSLGPMQSVFISPASDRQIQRASPSPSMSLIQESPLLYNQVTKPYIQSMQESGSLSWIENILSGKKEKERALLDTEDFLLNVDTKWRSHPNPKDTPREEWYRHEATSDLYCLAILKDSTIASLRDLRGEHLPILYSLLKDCSATIERVYGVSVDQLRVFFHYQPQFYHGHIHFTRLQNEVGAQVERGHLVSDVIQNLEMESDFYAKRTITYTLKVTDPLYKQIQEYHQKD